MAQVVWIFLVVSSALILTAAAPSEEIVKCTAENTDNSDSAKKAADEVSKFIDKSVDPCDDFYNFACGGFIKNHEIPSDGEEISQFINVNNGVFEQLHVLMKEPIGDQEPRWSKLTKQFFQTCSDTDAINKRGLKSIKELIKELGGWPVLEGENWKGDGFDWKKLIYKFRELGIGTNQFLMTRVDPSPKNSSTRVIAIGQIDTVIDRISLGKGFDDKRVQAYYKYMVDFASIFGANKDIALADMKDLINFMKDLSDITIPPEEQRDLTAMTNIMTVKELQTRFPYINWEEFLSSVIGPNVKITENDIVDVGMPKYVTNLESLLEKTPKRVVANYAITLSLMSTATYLSKEVRDLEMELGKALSGTSSVPPKWKECLGEVSENFKIATAALYARKYFTKEAKVNVAKLITTLHEKFIEMLQKVDWMDEKTKNQALEKAKAIKEHIAFPNELLDDKILNDYYESVSCTIHKASFKQIQI
uniref:Peptidase M13 N-terminal domain-containing protein n=1 Tax=Photinus pyralis TaxID=7054 RepID=A0A1Y1KTX7_PHOPY